MIDALAAAIKARRAVLFAGAGVSMGLGLPSWAQLMARMAKDLGYDPSILIGPSTNYLTVAEYYKLEKGSIGPLRSWMDREWHVEEAALLGSQIFKKIVELDFPFIYTTNWDRNLERSFDLYKKPFSKIVNAKDISLADSTLPHIVKFHGDFDDDSSIVIAEGDYFERLEFESPLDIKLRSDVLGRSILFLGYSLNDINMRLLLYKMQKMWKHSGYESERPPSYLFMSRPDAMQGRVLEKWGVQAITRDADKPTEALELLLNELLSAVASI